VLVDGRIVEDGAPLELLRSDGYFKRLFGDELLAA
jgi:ABC-type multidrug transport system fused ATPase/permease subunit